LSMPHELMEHCCIQRSGNGNDAGHCTRRVRRIKHRAPDTFGIVGWCMATVTLRGQHECANQIGTVSLFPGSTHGLTGMHQGTYLAVVARACTIAPDTYAHFSAIRRPLRKAWLQEA